MERRDNARLYFVLFEKGTLIARLCTNTKHNNIINKYRYNTSCQFELLIPILFEDAYNFVHVRAFEIWIASSRSQHMPSDLTKICFSCSSCPLCIEFISKILLPYIESRKSSILKCDYCKECMSMCTIK